MMSSALVARLRPQLEAKLDQVSARLARIEAHLTNQDRVIPQDAPDRAQVLENDEVLDALDAHDRDEITAIRRALQRMDDGVYGTCARCGEAIPPARLEALPLAHTCMQCA